MLLTPIKRVSGLTKEEFQKHFLEPLIPVVFTDLMDDWPAKEKWTFDYFKTHFGHLTVPVYDTSFSQGGKTYMSPTGTMKFGDYIDLIQQGPTQLRIFLWNILKQAPELIDDLRPLTIMNGFYKEFPFMFFGGQGSYTKIHYDVDCSHVFLNQFQKRKRVLLFNQNQSKHLQKVPFTVGCLVEMTDPDEHKFPGIKNVEGWETILHHGETLFIPSMFWHHIDYLDGSFSISLRANDSIGLKLKGAYHIAQHLAVDRSMNFLLGKKWMDIKINIAKRRAGVI
jgi:hypothetical protein